MAQKIGELLVSEGRISEHVLTRALEIQGSGSGMRLGGILLKWGLLREEELLRVLAGLHRVPAVDWAALSAASREAVALLSPAQAVRTGAIPYAVEKKSLRVAFVNPSDLAAVDEVQAITGKRLLPAVTTEVRLLQAHQRFYSRPISRDLWATLQRLASKANKVTQARVSSGNANRPSPAEPISEMPAPPEPTAAPSMAEVELLLPEQLAPPIDVRQAIGVPEPYEETPVNPEASAAQSDADPFSDDCSLQTFVEYAITFFDGLPNLRSARTDLVDEPVEDLDPSTREESPKTALDLDSTLPSRSRPRAAAAAELTG